MRQEGFSKLDYLAFFDSVKSGEFIRPQRLPCTGPLQGVFEQQAIPRAVETKFILDDSEVGTRVRRYRSDHPGSELLRLFYNDVGYKREAVLTLMPNEFEIGVKVDTRIEPIPVCDQGRGIVRRRGEVNLLHRGDFEGMVGGKGSMRGWSLRVFDTSPVRECPIYHRPVYDAPLIQTPSGEVTTQVEPDWSIRDVNAFSQEAMAAIIRQLDPINVLEEHERTGKPVRLEPTLRPAREIAELIVHNLGF